MYSHVPRVDFIAAIVVGIVLVLLLARIAFSLWQGRASFRIERSRQPFAYWAVMGLYSVVALALWVLLSLLLGPR